MPGVNWSNALDLGRAVNNVQSEFPGDWHQDPWGWPELTFFLKTDPALVYEHCRSTGAHRAALLDVPKENWGTRPAVVLNTLDRVVYQALVDRLSVDLIGELDANVFGWRLHPNGPDKGAYSHNDKQWEGYRTHLTVLGATQTVALTTDIVSFFANIPIEGILAEVDDRTSRSAPQKRLCDLLAAFDANPDRSGLPQRSLASAVLANTYLRSLDDMLAHYATPINLFGSSLPYRSFARWMDDIWYFCRDPAEARQVQTDLQSAALALGLNLNTAKTDVLEGDDVAAEALQIEHSAVDAAMSSEADYGPLEELIDRLLEKPEVASRTSIRFVSRRMRDHGCSYRIDDFLDKAARMPHVADAVGRLIKDNYEEESLEDWYLDYVRSRWATHHWSLAQLGRIFSSSRRPGNSLREFFLSVIADANSSLPLLALACQRISEWDPREARVACGDAVRGASTPHARRVLSLAALGAGRTRRTVMSWLAVDEENRATVAMLEAYGPRGARVQADFAN
jgi:hypothetical protein